MQNFKKYTPRKIQTNEVQWNIGITQHCSACTRNAQSYLCPDDKPLQAGLTAA